MKVSEVYGPAPPDPPALATALELLAVGLWPIPITSPDDPRAGSPGKQPIGLEWGRNRHTRETLRTAWRTHPKAGVGLKLGKEAGVIDVEVDDPAVGEETLVDLFGGEVVETRGWTSTRGEHRLFRWDDRLARYGKPIIKLPGVEVRVGALEVDGKQFQSVCPPSADAAGVPRRWNEFHAVAPLPDSFFAALDRLASDAERARPAPATIPFRGPSDAIRSRYGLAALEREVAALEAEPEGGRNDRLNVAAFRLGQLVGSGCLDRDLVEPVLRQSALAAGLGEREVDATIRSGMDAGQVEPRDVDHLGRDASPRPAAAKYTPPGDDEPDPAPEDRDATAADLLEADVTIRWVWEGWFPLGVLTILASEPGVGKTRFCADLLRRINQKLPWPDGSENLLPAGSKVLWVPADNQHSEIGSFPAAFGFDPDALVLNAPVSSMYGGTMLDAPEDLRDFEARIKRVRPVFVFVDTSLNATDRSAHKPEDAKAFFKPLQEIAARTQTSIVCVTHLNAGGKPLGRRITGQGRVVIQLEMPDPEGQPGRRRLHVVKSHSLFPPPLGVTMGASGNDYDDAPPAAPEDAPARKGGPPSLIAECLEWLVDYLDDGEPRRVSDIRTASDRAGFDAKTLYVAKDRAEIREFMIERYKWWQLTTGEAPF
jgi:hypothetical protein